MITITLMIMVWELTIDKIIIIDEFENSYLTKINIRVTLI